MKQLNTFFNFPVKLTINSSIGKQCCTSYSHEDNSYSNEIHLNVILLRTAFNWEVEACHYTSDIGHTLETFKLTHIKQLL